MDTDKHGFLARRIRERNLEVRSMPTGEQVWLKVGEDSFLLRHVNEPEDYWVTAKIEAEGYANAFAKALAGLVMVEGTANGR